MKKRSAMLFAASLVAALLAGGTALSFSLVDKTAAAQDPTIKPLVETRHRTITIHKKAKVEPAPVVTIMSPPSADAQSSIEATSASSDELEQELEDDGQEEEGGAEHEDETFQDQSGEHVGSEESGGDD
jgi:hypothetical protein